MYDKLLIKVRQVKAIKRFLTLLTQFLGSLKAYYGYIVIDFILRQTDSTRFHFYNLSVTGRWCSPVSSLIKLTTTI